MMLMALFENASIVCLQDKQQNIAVLRNSNYFEINCGVPPLICKTSKL